ncbi:MAG: electron transfer flavoprotein subunit alpha/FixB family protein, partial [Corynebacterium sp.]|nr:electron transfer flavoprotein subunit alpha/FixB family protein [Corynebacterium sp.]
MTNVLVLVEHTQGELKNSTLELITAARAFGTGGAVVVGAPGTAEKLQEGLAAGGAETIYAAESDDAEKYVVTPSVDAVSGLAAQLQVPVIIAAGAAGNEIAGRVGARVASGVLYDQIAVNADRSSKGSIFGGDFTVDSTAGGASPVYTLRAGAVDPEPQAASGTVQPVELPAAGPTALTLTNVNPAENADPPQITE